MSNKFLDFMKDIKDDGPIEEETSNEVHDWQTQKEKIFGCDTYTMECTKCRTILEVDENESIAEVMEREEVSRNCAEQVMAKISDE